MSCPAATTTSRKPTSSSWSAAIWRGDATPVLYQRLAAAKTARGAKIVVIDPRRTATCEIADLHLALAPGSDVAVFAGLLLRLVESERCDYSWIADRTAGFAAAIEAARRTVPSLAETAAIAGLPLADLARFYDWFAATDRTVTLFSQGVNQSSAGTDKVNAIINCHLATGRIGRPGTGPFSLTGQPNAMGGREVGGLANQLAAHMGFDAADIDRVRRFWAAPRMATRPGFKAVDLFDAVRDGAIKALWILGTNPAASMPRAARVRAALAACPFVAVSDCWPTDTTAFADIVLPAAGWGEKDGAITNSERCISRQRAFREPPGEARPDWWMLSEVARRMGWKPPLPIAARPTFFASMPRSPPSRTTESGSSTSARSPTLSDAEYDCGCRRPRWPAPSKVAASRPARARLFGERDDHFRHRRRQGAFRSDPVSARRRARARELGRCCSNTGRVRDPWHTMTRTGRVPRLMAHSGEPLLDIHPADAERLALAEGGLARIESRHGAMVLPVRVSMDQRRGEVFAPMHWTDRFTSAGPIARLVGAATDPLSGQPELKATPVRVAPVATLWRGLLLRRAEALFAVSCYWARVPLAGGHAFDLAGWEPLPSGRGTAAWIAELLGASAEAELVIYADPGRGAFRYASLLAGRLDACLFLARGAQGLPPREALSAMLGQTISPSARMALLAGRAGAEEPAGAGRTVCACFAVGLRTLHGAIEERRLTSVAEIGAALRAGTNCGSCVPELEAILRGARLGRASAA